jgi:hypothetical protein
MQDEARNDRAGSSDCRDPQGQLEARLGRSVDPSRPWRGGALAALVGKRQVTRPLRSRQSASVRVPSGSRTKQMRWPSLRPPGR